MKIIKNIINKIRNRNKNQCKYIASHILATTYYKKGYHYNDR